MAPSAPFSADVLFSQLGGALAMLGAHSIVTFTDGIHFRIRGSKRGNRLQIKLAPNDLYDVSLWKIANHGLDLKEVAFEGSVYVESLHATIEKMTGLATRL